MIGGEFVSHGPQQVAKNRVTSPHFPGVEDLGESFEMNEEWYAAKNFAPDLHVILVQETEGMKGDCYQRPPFPATWARIHGEGRVFYTSLGHRHDVWDSEIFQNLVEGGCGWAMGLAEAEIRPNLTEVTPDCGQDDPIIVSLPISSPPSRPTCGCEGGFAFTPKAEEDTIMWLLIASMLGALFISALCSITEAVLLEPASGTSRRTGGITSPASGRSGRA